MGVKGEALSRAGCQQASARGRVRRAPFIFPEILPPEAPGGRVCRGLHRVAPSLKGRAISSFMISLVPPYMRWTRASAHIWAMSYSAM